MRVIVFFFHWLTPHTVYAPDGVFEPRDVGTSNSWASSRTFDTEDGGEGVNTARSSMLYSEGENADDGDTSINPEPDRQQDRPTSPTSLLSRKPSFFRRVFKTKVSKGMYTGLLTRIHCRC